MGWLISKHKLCRKHILLLFFHFTTLQEWFSLKSKVITNNIKQIRNTTWNPFRTIHEIQTLPNPNNLRDYDRTTGIMKNIWCTNRTFSAYTYDTKFNLISRTLRGKTAYTWHRRESATSYSAHTPSVFQFYHSFLLKLRYRTFSFFRFQ